MRKIKKIKSNFYICKSVNNNYYAYQSFIKALLGILSPSLMFVYNQDELRRMYEELIFIKSV